MQGVVGAGGLKPPATRFGWRWTYGGVALLLAMVMIATRFILPKDFGHRSPDHENLTDQPQETEPQRSWTRSEVLRDLRIYLLLPGLLAPGIIITAMFFHHLSLATVKGWSYTWITGSYIIYAGTTSVTSLLIGQLIDRLGAVRLVPFMLVPLTLAMLVVAIFNNPFAVWLYMVLLGLSVGIAHTSVSAMWAEIYGVAHLGAIKSLMAALSVFGTALGPVSMGSLMDKGLSMEQVCLLFAGYAVMGMVLMVIAFRRKTDETPLVSHRIGD